MKQGMYERESMRVECPVLFLTHMVVNCLLSSP